MMIATCTYASPAGEMILAAQGNELIGAWIAGQKYFLSTVQETMEQRNDSPALVQAENWLNRYFAGERPALDSLFLAPRGSAFRQAVWRILCDIPYGQCLTYGDIARRIAEEQGRQHMSARAVGGAVGHNPISIFIPCHRVVGANGSLTGYAGGVEVKKKLLQLEGVQTP